MRSLANIVVPVVVCLLAISALTGVGIPGGTAAEKVAAKPDAKAVERTRKQVLMLDDLYKTAIVLVTDKYVNTDADTPAGTTFKGLFTAMKKKGWHEVRLVDATGDPLVEDNSPRDDFEKQAIAELKAGKASFEQTEVRDGKHFLRTATIVPVVMKKCIMCHPNYADVPEGKAIGALSYVVPIE